ncbi:HYDROXYPROLINE-RICH GLYCOPROTEIN FAMILY PROTEIN [Salix viminalis]|uniref:HYDROXYPROLINE-RICH GLYCOPROTEIN FAMILY PROTEIN n=1 Tax=Salix viminalis TaxID=40686 RepID=A0A9Q0U7V7_SALVM|nr:HYDROXYPROLINE-RICH GLYCOPROTEIN FAMILY PROTEIN [Salix viminalis]
MFSFSSNSSNLPATFLFLRLLDCSEKRSPSQGSEEGITRTKDGAFTFSWISRKLHFDDGAQEENNYLSETSLTYHLLMNCTSFYPEIIPRSQLSEVKGASIDKVLIYFCEALKSIGDSWMMDQEWIDKATYNMYYNNDHRINSEQIVEIALATLTCLIKIPREVFDVMDEYESNKDCSKSNAFSKILTGSYSDSSSPFCASPETPTSVLPQFMGSPASVEFANFYCSSPRLRSLRAQALGKLNPMDIKRLSFHMPSNLETQDGNSLNRKDCVDDETMAEMEAKSKPLCQTQLFR